MLRYWMTVVFLLTLTSGLRAEAVFSASATATEVVAGEMLEITYAVENGSLSGLVLSDLTPFDVVSGPARMQHMQIINGKVSRTVAVTYGIRSSRTGTFTIPGAEAVVDGKKRKSNTLTITVTGEDSPVAATNEGPPKGDLFIMVFADKNRLWEGEQVVLTYKLFYRINFENVQIHKSPAFEGFLMHDFNVGQPQERVETYRGERYYTLLFKKVALFPNRSGKLELSPMELQCTVYGDGSTRGSFFRTQRQKQVILRSNKLVFDVKPLPEAGRPADFSGAVGMFSLQSFPARAQATTGDGVTLKATLRGIGNLKIAHVNTPQMPDGLDVYGPTVKESFSDGSSALQGSKDFDFVIVPAREGQYTLPALQFCYFDPQSGSYETITAPAKQLLVTKGLDAPADQSTTTQGKSRWRGLLGEIARMIMYITGISVAILATLGLLFFWWWYWKKKRRKLVERPVVKAAQKAPQKKTEQQDEQQLKHQLVLLEQAVRAADAPSFYKIVPRVLWAAAKPADTVYDKQKLLSAIREKAPYLEAEVARLLQNAEWQLYGGGAAADVQGEYDAVLGLVEELRLTMG
jgi:hypothetical protein